jgi:hypothetical protein
MGKIVRIFTNWASLLEDGGSDEEIPIFLWRCRTKKEVLVDFRKLPSLFFFFFFILLNCNYSTTFGPVQETYHALLICNPCTTIGGQHIPSRFISRFGYPKRPEGGSWWNYSIQIILEYSGTHSRFTNFVFLDCIPKWLTTCFERQKSIE